MEEALILKLLPYCSSDLSIQVLAFLKWTDFPPEKSKGIWLACVASGSARVEREQKKE